MAAEEGERRWWGRDGSREEKATMTLFVIGMCDSFVDFGSFEVWAMAEEERGWFYLCIGLVASMLKMVMMMMM